MKIAPLNYVQIVLMALMVTCPMVGVDWPKLGIAMQITAACASAALAAVSLYSTPIAPASFLSAAGIQTVHIIQGAIGGVLTVLNGAVAQHPSWGPTIRVIADVGTIFMGVLGIFSPKAINGPLMARRIRKIAAGAPVSMDPPPTPREGLQKV